MIGNLVLTSSPVSSYINIFLSNDISKLDQVGTGNFGIDGYGIRQLHSLIQFRQVRMYCKKSSTIHIVSNKKQTGLINFLIMNGSCPLACGYKILSDDNSYLSRNCDKLFQRFVRILW